jgi:hypothetical protein
MRGHVNVEEEGHEGPRMILEQDMLVGDIEES